LAIPTDGNAVLLFDANSFQLVQTYDGHRREVSSLVFNGNGTWLVSGGFDGLIIVWEVGTGSEVKKLTHAPDSSIVAIATTPEVPFYAIGFMNGSIGIYNEEFAEPMMTFVAHSQVLMGLAVSRYDDTVVTVSEDRSVKVWQMRATATCKHTFEEHTDYALSVAMSPKEAVMITGSKDKTLKVWQYKSGKLICTILGHGNTIFEIDHHGSERAFVSCCGDGVVCVWDYDDLA
jgi:WD40 repeat protein